MGSSSRARERRQSFISTRDAAKRHFTFKECLFQGYAPDGGMFLPANLPSLSRDLLASWSGLSYKQLCTQFLQLFVSADEIPHADLAVIVGKAFAYVGRRLATTAAPATTSIALRLT